MAEFQTDFKTVGEIYEMNDSVRARLLELVTDLPEESASLRTEKGDWTVAGIVEHLAMVEEGMAKVAGHLLKKAEASGERSDGSAGISESLVVRLKEWSSSKGKAPEMVQPTNERSIAESLAAMEVNRRHLAGLKDKFETVDGRSGTFPHPVFGPMTAQDWLALIGNHESRHVEQIEQVLARES